METKKPATLFINGKAFDCTIVEKTPVKEAVNEEPIKPIVFSGCFPIRTEQFLGIKQLLTEMN
jgi:hypothetical protein